jgi:heme/copper-type cytochrome/quinol oxidase subunit 2
VTKGAAAIAVVLFVLLGFSVWAMFIGWNTAGATAMSDEAVGFMIGGIIFSIVVGCGLMFLVFYSSRSGYDEPGRLMRKDEE